jgi:fructose-1,6-bisphosphatase/sedoheptulose 1,7-bisphosphatase-like protein
MDGDLLNNIKKCIKEDKIDFVIMGTAGTTDGILLWVPIQVL